MSNFKNSICFFGAMPNRNEIMRAVLILGKLSGWPLKDMLDLTWIELVGWLDEAQKLEREIMASE